MGANHTLYIGNVPPGTRAKDLAVEFERFGELIRCDIPKPSTTSTCYAFVEYESHSRASLALAAMANKRFRGRRLIVDWAKEAPKSHSIAYPAVPHDHLSFYPPPGFHPPLQTVQFSQEQLDSLLQACSPNPNREFCSS